MRNRPPSFFSQLLFEPKRTRDVDCILHRASSQFWHLRKSQDLFDCDHPSPTIWCFAMDRMRIRISAYLLGKMISSDNARGLSEPDVAIRRAVTWCDKLLLAIDPPPALPPLQHDLKPVQSVRLDFDEISAAVALEARRERQARKAARDQDTETSFDADTQQQPPKRGYRR